MAPYVIDLGLFFMWDKYEDYLISVDRNILQSDLDKPQIISSRIVIFCANLVRFWPFLPRLLISPALRDADSYFVV